MPIYEYQCDLCSGEFEVRGSFFEAMNSAICPLCESNKTHRCWSAPSIISKSSSNSTAIPSYNATLTNVTAEGCGGAGIRADGVKIRGKNVKLRGNKQGGIVAKRSEVRIKGLEIE